MASLYQRLEVLVTSLQTDLKRAQKEIVTLRNEVNLLLREREKYVHKHIRTKSCSSPASPTDPSPVDVSHLSSNETHSTFNTFCDQSLAQPEPSIPGVPLVRHSVPLLPFDRLVNKPPQSSQPPQQLPFVPVVKPRSRTPSPDHESHHHHSVPHLPAPSPPSELAGPHHASGSGWHKPTAPPSPEAPIPSLLQLLCTHEPLSRSRSPPLAFQQNWVGASGAPAAPSTPPWIVAAQPALQQQQQQQQHCSPPLVPVTIPHPLPPVLPLVDLTPPRPASELPTRSPGHTSPPAGATSPSLPGRPPLGNTSPPMSRPPRPPHTLAPLLEVPAPPSAPAEPATPDDGGLYLPPLTASTSRTDAHD
ncbi:hypothetical protein PAPYR_5748 [Paratrimastix pyriformis]|uniref:Uncharacterized protein n=1 Tax=Paratrimastix pyriformis TaxID=342808 RepID=A0ABQ8UH19_9EUKA|nr:hypothetical protein PAPYR_5748 [Paratrimastix pyriformis]